MLGGALFQAVRYWLSRVLILIAASSTFDCSERSTTYAIAYRALIIDMMSS